MGYADWLYSEDGERAALRDACMRVGFFYIENHGIPNELVHEAFEWRKKFFDLPSEEKMEIYIDNTPHFRGYTPLYGGGKPDAEGKGSKCRHPYSLS